MSQNENDHLSDGKNRPLKPPGVAYTASEENRIHAAVHAGGDVPCPRCGHLMEPHDIPPVEAVSYVRHRLWLHCIGCRLGLVLDRPRGG